MSEPPSRCRPLGRPTARAAHAVRRQRTSPQLGRPRSILARARPVATRAPPGRNPPIGPAAPPPPARATSHVARAAALPCQGAPPPRTNTNAAARRGAPCAEQSGPRDGAHDAPPPPPRRSAPVLPRSLSLSPMGWGSPTSRPSSRRTRRALLIALPSAWTGGSAFKRKGTCSNCGRASGDKMLPPRIDCADAKPMLT